MSLSFHRPATPQKAVLGGNRRIIAKISPGNPPLASLPNHRPNLAGLPNHQPPKPGRHRPAPSRQGLSIIPSPCEGEG